MNRIAAAIAKAKIIIENKPAAEVDLLNKSLDMPFDMYCKFQELKSVASMTVLSMDEAMTIYSYLGNTPEHFNKQHVAVKGILLTVFKELLERQVKAAA